VSSVWWSPHQHSTSGCCHWQGRDGAVFRSCVWGKAALGSSHVLHQRTGHCGSHIVSWRYKLVMQCSAALSQWPVRLQVQRGVMCATAWCRGQSRPPARVVVALCVGPGGPAEEEAVALEAQQWCCHLPAPPHGTAGAACHALVDEWSCACAGPWTTQMQVPPRHITSAGHENK
jgi:hypothetical protein